MGDREKRIETLLQVIAGCEISLRQFPDDLKFRNTIEKTKQTKIQELKDLVYGTDTVEKT